MAKIPPMKLIPADMLKAIKELGILGARENEWRKARYPCFRMMNFVPCVCDMHDPTTRFFLTNVPLGPCHIFLGQCPTCLAIWWQEDWSKAREPGE